MDENAVQAHCADYEEGKTMPKMKSHRGSAKRFSRTGTGKIKRHKAMRNHMLGCKTTKRKRQLRAAELVASADMRRVERLLPYL